MKVLVGGIFHETNTYATPLWGATELSDFNQSAGADMLTKHRTARTCIGGMLAAAEELSIQIVPTYHAGAAPSGTISEAAFAELKHRLMSALEDALEECGGAVSAVCLDLHGAGVYSAKHHHDLEAEVGRSVRALLGDAIPLCCTLDLHANIGDEMATFFDLMIGFHYFPHTDQFERGDELMRLVPTLVDGELRPQCHVEHLPILMPSNSTDPGWPMARANEFAAELERRPGVVDCTIFHGFQFSDIENVGVHIVCITNDDESQAKRVAQNMAAWIWKNRDAFLLNYQSAEEAIAEAFAVPRSEWLGTPALVHETSDNPGGGATGDATFLLGAMLNAGFSPGEAAFGFIVDPEAVREAAASGVGACIDNLRLGGKMDPTGMHGEPLELRAVEVMGLSDGKFTLTALAPGLAVCLGPMAHIRALLVGNTKRSTSEI
eukprot:SAG31_NODE_1479_length_8180_cov_7.141684_6_plen_435_part_00